MGLKKLYTFYCEVKNELKQVMFPSKQEFTVNFFTVLLVIVLASFSFMLCDYMIHTLITFLLNIGK